MLQNESWQTTWLNHKNFFQVLLQPKTKNLKMTPKHIEFKKKIPKKSYKKILDNLKNIFQALQQPKKC